MRGGGLSPIGSRSEPFDAPVCTVEAIANPVVQTRPSSLPKLQSLGNDPVASPMRRPRQLGSCAQSFTRRGELSLEPSPIADHAALRRCPRPDSRFHRPRCEVGIRIAGRHLGDLALDADLSLELDPVKQQRRFRSDRQLASFSALVVGEKNEAFGVSSLEKNNARGGPAARVGRCQRHGGRLGQFRADRLGEPSLELPHRIGIDFSFAECGVQIFAAKVGDVQSNDSVGRAWLLSPVVPLTARTERGQ